MTVRWLRSTDALAADRESPVVCVVYDASRQSAEPPDLTALAAHTPPEVPLLLVGAPPEPGPVVRGPGRELFAIQTPPGQPAGAGLGDLAGLTGRADLVLLQCGAQVPPQWLERLRAAALSDAFVGTASPMGDDLLTDLSAEADTGRLDRRLAAAAGRVRPRVLIAGPNCLYVPRRTLDLIGGLSGSHETLAAAIAAISTRCLHAGLVNVLADDLYVGCDPPVQREAAARELDELDRGDEASPLRRSARIAEAAAGGLSVTIDARALGPTVGGTQRYTLELLLALARFTDLRLRAVVAHDIDPVAVAELQAAGRVQVISYEQAVARVTRSHVVHRPQQVFSTGDMNLLNLLGRRLVVTHQDLIAYHNPSYHQSFDAWVAHRWITRQALAAADRVVFFSEHTRRDAVAEDLVGPAHCEIIGASVFANVMVEPAAAPPRAPRDRPFVLCLGSDYRHKNRLFAIAVVRSLRVDHGWTGQLVLAGGHVPYGSSRVEEQRLLTSDPTVREAVIDIGSVSDAERSWLLAHARAVIVPSVVEGFGLVPLEAAQAGVPCLFAAQPPLTEVIDRSLATLIAWEPGPSAERVLPLLSVGPPRERHLQLLGASAGRWSWKRIAGRMADCYAQTMRSPYRVATAQALQAVELERRYQEVEHAHRALVTHIGDRVALASDEGFLTAHEQRGLLRVGSRPVLARGTLWPFAMLGAIPRPRRRRP